jgi:hypothetical protein
MPHGRIRAFCPLSMEEKKERKRLSHYLGIKELSKLQSGVPIDIH